MNQIKPGKSLIIAAIIVSFVLISGAYIASGRTIVGMSWQAIEDPSPPSVQQTPAATATPFPVPEEVQTPTPQPAVRGTNTPKSQPPTAKPASNTTLPSQKETPTHEGNKLTPSPDNRKRVQFVTTELSVDGTYSCYEDRVNELTRIENDIKWEYEFAEWCVLGVKSEWKEKCNPKCGYQTDEEWTVCREECRRIYGAQHTEKCLPKFEEIGAMRRQYQALVNEICP